MRLVSVAGASSAGYEASHPVSPTGVLRWAISLLVLTNLGNLSVADLGGRNAPLFLSDMGVIVVVAIGAVAALRSASLRLDSVAFVGLVFAAVGGLSAVAAMPRFGLNLFEVVVSLAYLARWATYLALYIVVINYARDGDSARLWGALETTILAFAAFGIFQSAFLPDFGPMMYPDAKLYAQIDPQGHRLVSTILEPNIAAAMIIIVLLVQVGQLTAGVQVPRWKPALLFVALILTLSRSGALAFVCGMLVVLLAHGLGKKVFRFFTVMMLLVIASSPALIPFAASRSKLGLSDGSAMARLITWQRAISTWFENPWFGIGFNTYGFVQERKGFERFGSGTYSAEGGLLFVGVMTGIVGLVIFGTMLWFVLRRCGWIARNPFATPDERGLAIGVSAATVAVVVHSTFVNSLLVNFVMEELWILWALLFIAVVNIRRRAEFRTA